jgi:hypothetical protein
MVCTGLLEGAEAEMVTGDVTVAFAAGDRMVIGTAITFTPMLLL